MTTTDLQRTPNTPLFIDPHTGPIFLGDTVATVLQRRWPVLVVDDDAAVHSATRLALRGLVIQGRTVEILEAHSDAGARAILARRTDIALMLVDVVMETDDAGLQLVNYVRHNLDNHVMRILLSTGQPGVAPEETVMTERDINGYLSKSDLTARRLRSAVTGAIRSYHDLRVIHRQASLIECVAQIQARFIENEPTAAVSQAMLGDILHAFSGVAGMLVARAPNGVDLRVLATTEPLEAQPLATELLAWMDRSLQRIGQEGDLGVRRTPSDAQPFKLTVPFAETWLLPLRVGRRVLGAAWLAVPVQSDVTTDAAMEMLAQAAGSLLAAMESAERRLAAEAGRASAYQWLQGITANLPDALLVSDGSGRIKLANGQFCETFEIPADPESLVGLECGLAANASAEQFVELDGFVPRLNEITAQREVVRGELLEMVDGRWLERDFVPLEVSGVPAVLWQYRDVTATRQALAEVLANQARYASLFHAATDAILILSRDGAVVDANAGAQRLFDIDCSVLIGMRVSDLFHVTGRAWDDLVEPMLRGEAARFEDTFRRADGSVFPAEFSGSAMHVNEQWLVQAFVRDLTGQRQEQAALLAAKEAAEAASAAKSQFLAVMSHEIRTPINAILGSSELLGASELRRSQRELAAIVQNGSEVLLSLINDLLDFSKIEAGQMELELGSFDLAALLENVLDIVRVRAHARGLTLHCEVDPLLPQRVVGDANRVRQIASNLLSNAIKFTEVGEVSMTLRVLNATSESVDIAFTVADTGIGIDPERTETVFESFKQADSGITRRFGGTGLGLSIVRSLVALMDGDLQMVSLPGVGTTVAVKLHLAVPPNVGVVGSWPGANPPTGSVLVICAQSKQRASIVQILAGWGLRVVEAGDVGETLDCLADLAPDCGCVVIDDAQFEMDSAEIVTAVRSIQASAHVPVLMATSLRSNDADMPGVIAIARPMHRGRLRLAIAQALGLRISETPDMTLAQPEQAGALSGRILVAEDNRENAILLRHTLTGAGYVVDEVSDGEAAVAAVIASQFSLVLMDVEMPLLDGIAATQRIRDWERTYGRRPTPIIAVTAHAISEIRERCMAAGMNDYMSKPLRRKRVLDTTANWLDRRPLILVADDDQSSRLIVRTWLKPEKQWRHIVVGDGQEVLDAFGRYPVAVVVLDLEMPGLDGFKTVQQLRRLPGGQNVPIIAMTGHVGPEVESRCRLAGFTDHVNKPYSRETLLQVLRKHTARQTDPSHFRAPAIGVRALQITVPTRPLPDPEVPPKTRTIVSPGVTDLLPEFVRGQARNTQHMREALARGDYQRIGELSRVLRQVSGVLEFAALVQTAEDLEVAAARHEHHAVARSLRKIEFMLTAASEQTAS